MWQVEEAGMRDAEFMQEVIRAYRPMRTPWRAIKDYCTWLSMKTHRYAEIETDNMGCPRDERPGYIWRVYTPPCESEYDQTKIGPYVYIRYGDGTEGREPKCVMFYNEAWDRYEYTR
jgi:hypothetical protein